MTVPEPARAAHDEGPGVANALSGGAVSGVVQAGAVHGGVHLHVGPPPPAPVVPRQLPAAPGAFAGRAAELAALDRALAGGSPGGAVVVSAIGGAGGVGKTWLALAWAHRNLDRFPDGQLFVDLRGFSPAGRPTEPVDALRGFLDALGADPDRLPPEPEALAALYRSLVAGRRVLVVLDNAATAEQVVPLLPGSPTCAVLVTGRTTLPSLIDRHGARHLPLDVLTRAEAHALLTARLGDRRVAAEPAVTDELIGLCGGHPLALAITARHAATRPGVPLAEFAAELRDLGLEALDHDTDPAAGLPAVLSWSLRGLTDEQRTAFALVGIAPGPDIDLGAAASLAGLPDARARRALRVLEEHSLLDRRAHGRFAMHDLVRAYAATTARDLPEPVRRAALERVADFYAHTACAADRLLHPHRPPIRLDPPAPGARPLPLPDNAAALAWMDTHHRHLLAAQHTAAAQRRHHTAWNLAWAMTTFHQLRGHHRDELAAWRTAADAAAHLPDPTHQTLTHRLLGHAHAALGQHDQATTHLRRALALAEQHHDTAQQAHTHHALTQAWARRGEDRQALEHARHALRLYRALDQPAREADCLNAVGWCLARLGDHDTAREHCQAALTLHRLHHNPDGEAATLDSLGHIEHRTGHHERAVRHYEQALALYRTLDSAPDTAEALDSLGHPCAALGDHDRARALWREALELYGRMGRDDDAERVRRHLADVEQEDRAVEHRV